jgi:hypothetical protein
MLSADAVLTPLPIAARLSETLLKVRLVRLTAHMKEFALIGTSFDTGAGDDVRFAPEVDIRSRRTERPVWGRLPTVRC